MSVVLSLAFLLSVASIPGLEGRGCCFGDFAPRVGLRFFGVQAH